MSFSGGFAFIVVLFILLIILRTAFVVTKNTVIFSKFYF
ncbi:YjcZ family sporulation protein [Bacillus sp. SA1-12]|nr:YjcZ family sporulation protein [Bacillus sp. SA1-12]